MYAYKNAGVALIILRYWRDNDLAKKCQNNIRIIHTRIYNYNQHQENICNIFKDSAEHEYLFYSSICDFLNSHSQFIISRTLNKWNKMFGYSYKKPSWCDTKIHKVLITDIDKYKYRIGLIDNILLKNANPVIRIFTINIKKIINKYKNLFR